MNNPEKPEDQNQAEPPSQQPEQDAVPLMAGLPQPSEQVMTGLTAAPEQEADKTLTRDEIDGLRQSAELLGNTYRTIDGLEALVVYNGGQTLADRYGAETIVTSLQDTGIGGIGALFERLEPDKQKREQLLDDIAATDSTALYERINREAGGAWGNHAESPYNMDFARRSHMDDLKNKGTNADFIEDDDLSAHNTKNTFNAHPELVEEFKQSGNLIAFVGELRQAWTADSATYDQLHAEIGDELNAMVAAAEQETENNNSEVGNTLAGEIMDIEQKIAAAGNEIKKQKLEAMLERRTQEAQQHQETVAAEKMQGRLGVYGNLGLGAAGLANAGFDHPEVYPGRQIYYGQVELTTF